MYQPATYAMTLAFMIISMLCWGSWANTVKLCPGYRFQLFYWDYVIGLVVGVLFWGLTLGSHGTIRPSLPRRTDSVRRIEYRIRDPRRRDLQRGEPFARRRNRHRRSGGRVSRWHRRSSGRGSGGSYLISPAGNPLLLFGGIAFVVAAILFDAAAYRLRDTDKLAMSKRGVVISVISGLLMGSFYPFVAKAMDAADGQGPYATAFFFVLGVAACAVPVNYLLMRKPLDGREPVGMQGYWQANRSWHLWGIVGGAIWCTGAVLNFVASRSQTVGPAISYSIGQGATMISAGWGVFVWREFSHAPKKAKAFLAVMFVFFLIGLTAVALAPIL